MKGGYKIIDLSGYNFTAGTAQTVAGIYAAIEGSYHKPLLIEGLVVGGVEKHGAFAQAVLSSTDYVIDLSDYKITVTNTNEVTVTAQGA